MFHLDHEGTELTDTWHESIGDAFAQAEFEFGIKPEEWSRLDAGSGQ